jgi:dephospho-CoA kinase
MPVLPAPESFMLKVGLTGSIGSGKSTVARIFGIVGVPVFSADDQSKMFLSEPHYKGLITRAFGEQILDPDGRILNKRLAAIVFSDREALSRLNAILHPAVRDAFGKWLGKQNSRYVVHEAAILFESGFYRDFDKVIAVTAPEQIRIERVMRRDHVTRKDVVIRMDNQWNDEEKVKRADFVIFNDNEQLVVPQVLRIHRELLDLTK